MIMKRVLGAVFALCFAASAVFGQGVTTSAISGVVNDSSGKPVAGATVTILHEPSGTRVVTTTGANGAYNASGLRIGGPYTITAVGAGLPSTSQKEIYLTQGSTQEVQFSGAADVVKLDSFKVNEARDTTFGMEKTSNATVFNVEEIAVVPIVRQDVQELANLDPRINLVQNTSTGEFQMSAQGQNFRYNSFLVDGLESNDPFGLNGNGFASLRSPVPLVALEGFNVNFTPYDVRYTGFTGALINAVTKSGTNEIHGSADYRYSDQDMRGKNPVSGLKESLRDRTYTLAVGGPIIKDKLFFFLTYDDFKRVSAPPGQIFVPTDPTQISAIVAKAKALGYDTGSFDASNIAFQKTKLAKIDWNISDQHRAKFSYRRVEGSNTAFANYNLAFTTSFSNYWYQTPRLSDNYVAQIDSQWNSNLHTEATAAYIKYDGTPKNNGTAFPEVNIGGITGHKTDTNTNITTGDVLLGTEFSRQLNFIFTKEKIGKFYADYTWGNHVFLAGGDADKTTTTNKFAQAYNGTYIFPSVAAFLAGTPITSYQDAKLFPGFTIDQAFAVWSQTNYGAVIQDTWRPNSRLTLVGGLRLTYPYSPVAPITAVGFSTAGFSYNGTPITKNNTTNDGSYTLAPRFSFSWDIPGDRKTSVRGGAGVFSGTNPAVWLSNAYSNAGALGRLSVSNPPGLSFVADPANQPPVAGVPPAPVINVTDPKFKPATYMKSNLGIDHQLPFGGLILTAEASYNKVIKTPFTVSLNLKPVGTMPDGRIRYAGNIYPGYNTGVAGVPTASTTAGGSTVVTNTAFNNVLYVTDSDQGYSRDFTFGVSRPMKNHWAFSAYWTRMKATEVNPQTSSVAASNYSGRAYVNPNEDVASNSNYSVPDKIVVRLAKQFDFFHRRNTRTTISLAYRSQTGHPFSWVFRGDANGDGNSTDLLYVPTGPNDPKVVWNSPTERDAFFAFVNSTSLAKYAGQITPRNSEYSKWQKTLDLHFAQQIPIYGQARMEVFADCTNLANLLNKNWGVVEGIDFPYYRSVAGATVTATGQYQYFFNSSTLAGVPVYQDLSRYQIQIGARLSF
jgi:hypothetical protein